MPPVYDLSYSDFINFNPHGQIEVVLFIILVVVITLLFSLNLLGNFVSRKSFYTISIILTIMLILFIVRFNLMWFWHQSQGQEFSSEIVVLSTYQLILSFGQLTYELNWLCMTLIAMRVVQAVKDLRTKHKDE